MNRRGLILDTYSTADFGWTMSKLSLSTPAIEERYVTVDGMHGQLDYCDMNGRPIYKTRTLEAVFELSEGDFKHREQIITDFIRAVHGKKCPIVHPDHGGKLLSGRVLLQKDFSDLAHAQVSLSAICQPWFEDPHDTFLEIPILDRSHNRLSFGNVHHVAEYSTCAGAITGDTEAVTVTLSTSAAPIGSCAVFAVQLEPETTYYVSGRTVNKGVWFASDSPDRPTEFCPIAKTGESGILYLFLVRMQSYSAVTLNDIFIVPSRETSILCNGSFDSPVRLSKPDGISTVVSINGRSSAHYVSTVPSFTIPEGDCPAAVFRRDTSQEAAVETLRWRRRWLE